MGKDYYKILGVERNSSQDEIKRAFRKKAHEYHPDKATGNEEKFKEINEAYQVLGNKDKRKQYDQFGSTFEQQGGFGGGVGWDDFMKYARTGARGQGFSGSVNFDFGDLGDIFGDLFGFGGRRSKRHRQSRGADLQIEMDLDFKEAVFGAEKEFEIYKKEKCSRCKGNGAEPGSKIVTCQTCGGQGKISRLQQTILGSFQSVIECPKCQGQGSSNEQDCKSCHGNGIIRELKKLKVKIPPGIDNGETIRLSGQGEAGSRGAPSGDLYINVRVKPDQHFRRDRYDIYSEETMSISQAVLGGKIPVKTIDGEVNLKIPEGTPSGKIFKLKSKGITHINSSRRGDHYVQVHINIPQKLTRKQKNLFKDLAQEGL